MAITWFWGGENNSFREFDAQSGAAMAAARTGMSGSYCLDLIANGDYAAKTVANAVEYYVGFRYEITSILAFPPVPVTFYDGAVRHCGLVLDSSGHIRVFRNTAATILATGTAVINVGTTYLIEVYAKIDDSAGRVVVKVNGVSDIDFTGDTRNAAAAQINSIRFGYNGDYYSNAYFDDIVIRTDSYTGDVRVGGKNVTANGTTNQWDASAGDNYACVADVDDADYVSTNTNDEIELYALANVTESIATVQALKISTSARIQGASTPQNLKLALRSNGTNYFSTDKALPAAYGVDIFNIWETDPDDSQAWTEAKINALEVGFQAAA